MPRFMKFTSSTIISLANPISLLLYITLSFIVACWKNWSEVKDSVQSAWMPLEKASIAIFQLLANPQTLLLFALFALTVNIFREAVRQVSQGLT